jgi:hypothetical protein
MAPKEQNRRFIKLTTALVMQSNIQTFSPLLERPPAVNPALNDIATAA